MGITSITVTQDNKEGAVDLLSIHNPLIFIIEVEFTGAVEDFIYATIAGVDYICPFYSDESTWVRRFFFIADEILRSQMDALVEITQTSGTIISVTNLTKEVAITFSNLVAPVSEVITVTCIHAANDFESIYGAAMVNEYNNESKYYVGAATQPLYLYWYNDNAANLINQVTGIAIGADTNESAQNSNDLIAINYSDWISGSDYLHLLLIYPSFIPTFANSYITVTAQFNPGDAVTFSNVVLGTSMSYTIAFNGTATAQLKIKFESLPTDGEYIRFTFDAVVEGMPLGGVAVSEMFGTVGSTYDKGFIRKRYTPALEGIAQEEITINGVSFPHTVKVRKWCTGDYMIKYVDRNGQFRFIPFNNYAQRTGQPVSIGDINQFITSLKTNTGNKKQIGYNNSDTLLLTSIQLNESEITLLKDLYNSHEIYVQIASKWLRVEVSGDNISELERKKFKDLTITVKLPQSYNISLL